jgi:hypothetical protein
MSEYVYQEFPKWKYHPKHEAKIVQNAAEEKALGRGWVDRPIPPKKPSRSSLAVKWVKPLWTEWEWSFTAVIKVGGVLSLLWALYFGLRHVVKGH